MNQTGLWSKVFVGLFRTLAYAWLTLIVVGVALQLYTSIERLGFWHGLAFFADGFVPWNLIAFLVHLLELSPALAFFWIAMRIDSGAASGRKAFNRQ